MSHGLVVAYASRGGTVDDFLQVATPSPVKNARDVAGRRGYCSPHASTMLIHTAPAAPPQADSRGGGLRPPRRPHPALPAVRRPLRRPRDSGRRARARRDLGAVRDLVGVVGDRRGPHRCAGRPRVPTEAAGRRSADHRVGFRAVDGGAVVRRLRRRIRPVGSRWRVAVRHDTGAGLRRAEPAGALAGLRPTDRAHAGGRGHRSDRRPHRCSHGAVTTPRAPPASSPACCVR